MLDLLDYRRRVHTMYAIIRDHNGDETAYQEFMNTRHDLFQHHKQSALDEEQKARFMGLSYYEYNPAFRTVAELDTNVEAKTFKVVVGDDGVFTYRRIGRVSFSLPTGDGSLGVFWIEGYGGGIFLPFGDLTNKDTTYGAGRYLYDTIKGADLGTKGNKMVLDFNYAYNPSCSYNYRWICPLASQENKLNIPIPAGEKIYSDASTGS